MAVARWNSGFYFTKCARCGQDLIRTAYGHWHVPRGYRVVWQAQQPANAPSAKLVRQPGTYSPESSTELPIQEVLRHLQNGSGPATEQIEGHASHAAPETPVARQDVLILSASASSRIPDFMDEATGAGAWETPSRAYLLRPRAPSQERGESLLEGENPDTGLFARLRTGYANALNRRHMEREVALEGGRAGADTSRNIRLALILGIPVILILLALILWNGRENDGGTGAYKGATEGGQIIWRDGQEAFVTASLLNCRSAPALESESVKILARGARVHLVAREREWVSLVHGERQCWAPARYFSRAEPSE